MTSRSGPGWWWRARHGLVGARRHVAAFLRRVLPEPARRFLRGVDERLDPVHLAVHRLVTRESRPVPPRLLRERVGASTIESYFATGERWAELVERGLEAAGTSLAESGAILDFGAGAGKVIRHLGRAGGPELHACDIHPASVAWMDANLPSVTAARNDTKPPLPYPAGRFGAVYAWSIFSHIDAQAQRAWLGELQRVLVPGGVLLASVLGERSPDLGEPEEPLDVAGLRAEGINFRPYRRRGSTYAEFAGSDEEAYGTTHVTEGYVRQHWTAWFDVVEILPLALDDVQDVVVMRSKGGEPEQAEAKAKAAGHA